MSSLKPRVQNEERALRAVRGTQATHSGCPVLRFAVPHLGHPPDSTEQEQMLSSSLGGLRYRHAECFQISKHWSPPLPQLQRSRKLPGLEKTVQRHGQCKSSGELPVDIHLSLCVIPPKICFLARQPLFSFTLSCWVPWVANFWHDSFFAELLRGLSFRSLLWAVSHENTINIHRPFQYI